MSLRNSLVSPILTALAVSVAACGEPTIEYYYTSVAESGGDGSTPMPTVTGMPSATTAPMTTAPPDPSTTGGMDATTGDVTGPPMGAPPVAPNGFYVVGNQLFNYQGNPVVLHGVNRPSLEWNPQGQSLAELDYIIMAQEWGSQVVRIPINQGFWLAGSAAYEGGYRVRIAQQIQWAENQGMAVILDLHWSDCGNANLQPGDGGPCQSLEQQCMADARSVQFWREVATEYADDGQVMFELYNEPHDVEWEVWRNGGAAGGNCGGLQVVGMQQLYDTVRATGADNVVIVGGLDYAYDLSAIANINFAIDGYNIVYATHPYDNSPSKQPNQWPNRILAVANQHPVIATEFGGNLQNCDTSYVQQFLPFAQNNNIGWVGWAWFPASCQFPSLISDASGTPTEVGTLVRNAM